MEVRGRTLWRTHTGLEKEVSLDAKMLNFSVGLATSEGNTSYAQAVDGHLGQKWSECANSALAPSRPVWLTIDLGRLYSVNNVKMLSRGNYGRESEIYVGKSKQREVSTQPKITSVVINILLV